MKKISVITAAIFSLAYVSTAGAATSTDCSALGYNAGTADCTAGSRDSLKCPFNNSMVFCGKITTTCPSVSVGQYEKCTKKCATDNNVCIEKKPMTCSEYISANNGEKIADGDTIRGNKTRSLYLMGTAKGVTGSYAHLNNATLIEIDVRAAEDIPACKAEGAKAAYLDLKGADVDITGHANFYVKTDLGYLTYQQGSNPTWYWASFYRDTTIQNISIYASSFWKSTLNLTFGREYGKPVPTSKVNLTCDGNGSDSGRPDTCSVDINVEGANVTYSKNISGSNVELNVTCNQPMSNDEGSCTEGYSYY